MKQTLYLALILLIFSCSSRKFNFSQAYHFKKHSYQLKHEPIIEEPPLIASNQATLSHSSEPSIPGKLSLPQIDDSESTLTSKEKRALRNHIKQTVKQIRKVSKSDPQAAEILAAQKVKEITDDKVYAGAVIGIAGLILLILDIVTPLGVLAVVIGLVLIVWGLLERGPRRI